MTEHLPERLSIPGFSVGRRYRAINAGRQFFTAYEVDSPSVLSSQPYRERLNEPTTLTREIMSDGFAHASRTVCERRDVVGSIRGAVAITVETRDGAAVPSPELQPLGAALRQSIVHRESWFAVTGDPPSAEEELRGPDERISRCLLVEFLETESALETARIIGQEWPEANVGVYALMCVLHAEAAA
ncbi:hypothetical protein AB0323_00155 [Arthrobacter sp. NPDC080031]|uniref:hypothetical protein n=1 Tax=Arthrobacter sp. NPDC080031 TaxID=3155918 RepID=UPI00344E3187